MRIELINEIFFEGKRQVLDACVDYSSYQVICGQGDRQLLECHFRGFRAQYVYVHYCLDLPYANFNVPPCQVQEMDIFLSYVFVQFRGMQNLFLSLATCAFNPSDQKAACLFIVFSHLDLFLGVFILIISSPSPIVSTTW